jgi:hypothetical protein
LLFADSWSSISISYNIIIILLCMGIYIILYLISRPKAMCASDDIMNHKDCVWRLWYFQVKTHSRGYLGHCWEELGERNFSLDSLKSMNREREERWIVLRELSWEVIFNCAPFLRRRVCRNWLASLVTVGGTFRNAYLTQKKSHTDFFQSLYAC